MELFFIILIIVAVLWAVFSSRNKQSSSSSGPRDQNFHWNSRQNTSNRQSLVDEPEKFWVPQDKSVRIQGYEIEGGLIYVGSNLMSVSSGHWKELEPALINPRLKVNKRNPDYGGHSLGYWPSYSQLSPNARSAYLEWLSDGKQNQETPIGYIFLYFYGLERRVLYDLRGTDNTKKEISGIQSEVSRLLNIYGDNHSFRRYASKFLDLFYLFNDAGRNLETIEDREDLYFPTYLSDSYYQQSFNFNMGLSLYALENKPLPADWALKWAVLNSQLNTPARRCPEKLQELFRSMYSSKFGDGVILSGSRQKLNFRYKPASGSFSGSININTNLNDFGESSEHLNTFQALLDQCTDKLDPYSRYLGRNPESPQSLEAISNLPKEIINDYLSEDIEEFVKSVKSELEDQDFTMVPTSYFTQFWDIKGINKYRKNESIEIAQFFFKFGLGIEPDLRFGSAKYERDSKVVFFKLDPNTYPTAPSKEYKLALPILHLTSVIGIADGTFSEEEEEFLEEYLERLFKLSNEEKHRLKAYLYWLVHQKPGVRGIKKKMQDISTSKRESIFNFLIQVADADGYIDPDEVKMLQKTGKIFDLEPDQVYTAIHNRQTADDNPVLVLQGEQQKGYKIPAEDEGNELDEELIQQTLKKTEEVQTILADIFSEEEEEIEESHEPDTETDNLMGLDKTHSVLVKQLIKKPKWTQMEYERKCSELDLFPAGAQEVINDEAFERYDEPLLIKSDVVEINSIIVKKLQP